jgi:hypothetical protein
MSEAIATEPINLGFLTVFAEGSAYLGGYLITNSWGRPLEFRLSTAVQPNKVQQILYGSSLAEYLSADLIGKTLMDKSATSVQMLFTDSLVTLAIRKRLNIPTLAIIPQDDPQILFLPADQLGKLQDARSSIPLLFDPRADCAEQVRAMLERIDAAMDVSEPFIRIREAMGEARKMGVNRAA